MQNKEDNFAIFILPITFTFCIELYPFFQIGKVLLYLIMKLTFCQQTLRRTKFHKFNNICLKEIFLKWKKPFEKGFSHPKNTGQIKILTSTKRYVKILLE